MSTVARATFGSGASVDTVGACPGDIAPVPQWAPRARTGTRGMVGPVPDVESARLDEKKVRILPHAIGGLG